MYRHLIIPEIFCFSKVSWNKLSKEDQELITKLSREAQIEQRKLWNEKVIAIRAQMAKDGVITVETDKKTFYDLTTPVRVKYGIQYVNLIEQIAAVR